MPTLAQMNRERNQNRKVKNRLRAIENAIRRATESSDRDHTDITHLTELDAMLTRIVAMQTQYHG